MKSVLLGFLSTVFLGAFAAEPLADVEIWNRGVDFYQQGDVTNALSLLRELLLSRSSYGARAAEVVAKLEYERGNQEEAANAAQIALRANAKDGKANRNFTRATNGLLEARRSKHIDEVLAKTRGKDPGEILASATLDARELLRGAGCYRTNEAPMAVRLADAYRAQAERLADCWIPVREAIVQSVTNEEQSATILQQIADAETRTKKAAVELGELTDDAYGMVSSIEHDFTRFLKLTAMPPSALDFDFESQSNAWRKVEAVNGREWQRDALDFTRAFRAKFPAWARAYEQEVQSDTNKPPFTAEDQAKISAMATELEKLQLECCEQRLPTSQEKAFGLIREIRELLPKDYRQSAGEPQGQPPPPKDDRQKKDNQQQDQDDRQTQPENQDVQQESDQQPESNDDNDEQPVDADLESVMKKAQERNDEHEAEKRARMRKAPLPPNERDW